LRKQNHLQSIEKEKAFENVKKKKRKKSAYAKFLDGCVNCPECSTKITVDIKPEILQPVPLTAEQQDTVELHKNFAELRQKEIEKLKSENLALTNDIILLRKKYALEGNDSILKSSPYLLLQDRVQKFVLELQEKEKEQNRLQTELSKIKKEMQIQAEEARNELEKKDK